MFTSLLYTEASVPEESPMRHPKPNIYHFTENSHSHIHLFPKVCVGVSFNKIKTAVIITCNHKRLSRPNCGAAHHHVGQQVLYRSLF